MLSVLPICVQINVNAKAVGSMKARARSGLVCTYIMQLLTQVDTALVMSLNVCILMDDHTVGITIGVLVLGSRGVQPY